VDGLGLALTLGVGALAALAAWRWRPPGGALVLGLAAGVLLQDVAGRDIVLPPPGCWPPRPCAWAGTSGSASTGR
jgi:uncharacterized membrane protein AbrB (regulator of aidB expression)